MNFEEHLRDDVLRRLTALEAKVSDLALKVPAESFETFVLPTRPTINDVQSEVVFSAALDAATDAALAADEAKPDDEELFSKAPDFTVIPDALAKYAEADETAAQFRARLKSLWQRFGIEDGKNFPGGGEALTGEEKITMREIDIVLNSDEGKNAGLLEWMKADKPQD